MSKPTIDKDILSALSEIDKVSPYATFLDQSTLSTVDDYIDTGSMPLNAIISGSLYGGLPRNRVTLIAGESMCLTADQKIKVYKFSSKPQAKVT